MRRREFIVLGGAATAWPLAAHAQQTGKLPIVGYLGVTTAAAQNRMTSAFVQRMRELGWIEGRTVAIEYRWAEGRTERFTEIATEFVQLKVDVIVTSGAGARCTGLLWASCAFWTIVRSGRSISCFSAQRQINDRDTTHVFPLRSGPRNSRRHCCGTVPRIGRGHRQRRKYPAIPSARCCSSASGLGRSAYGRFRDIGSGGLKRRILSLRALSPKFAHAYVSMSPQFEKWAVPTDAADSLWMTPRAHCAVRSRR